MSQSTDKVTVKKLDLYGIDEDEEKLTLHHIIPRELKSKSVLQYQSYIRVSKSQKIYKKINKEVMDRIMAEAVSKNFPQDGDQPGSLPEQN